MDQSTFQPGPLADARCEDSNGRPVLVFTRDLRHPPEQVWTALTDPAQLRAWAPYTASRDLGAAGDVTLTMIDGEQDTDLKETVRRAERPSLLEYTWGGGLLRWELERTPAGETRLTLRHTVDDRAWVPRVAAGWHQCLAVAGHLLDGRPIPPIRGKDALNYGWAELHQAYSERLGIADPDWRDDLDRR